MRQAFLQGKRIRCFLPCGNVFLDEPVAVLCHEKMIGWTETPVGWARVELASGILISLSFTSENPAGAFQEKPHESIVQAAEACSAGTDILPFLTMAGTPFQRKVWCALSQIPRGETRTYREVAEVVAGASHARAVAQACGRNAIAFFIPCHRVVAMGEIGGFRWGIKVKRSLLEWEGGGGDPRDFFRSFYRA